MDSDLLQFKSKDESESEKGAELANRVAAFAYEGYLLNGRGLVIMHVDEDYSTYGAPGTPQFDELGWPDPQEVIEAINRFDPERLYGVMLVLANGDLKMVWRTGSDQHLAPREAYELIGDQRCKPTGPPGTLHRFPGAERNKIEKGDF